MKSWEPWLKKRQRPINWLNLVEIQIISLTLSLINQYNFNVMKVQRWLWSSLSTCQLMMHLSSNLLNQERESNWLKLFRNLSLLSLLSKTILNNFIIQSLQNLVLFILKNWKTKIRVLETKLWNIVQIKIHLEKWKISFGLLKRRKKLRFQLYDRFQKSLLFHLKFYRKKMKSFKIEICLWILMKLLWRSSLIRKVYQNLLRKVLIQNTYKQMCYLTCYWDQ